MKYAYICRMEMNASTVAGWYLIKYIEIRNAPRPNDDKTVILLYLHEARPPVHRRRSDGTFSWDYANEPIKARQFHRDHPHIRLKPGEGPILVDLDDVSTKRTSKHPED